MGDTKVIGSLADEFARQRGSARAKQDMQTREARQEPRTIEAKHEKYQRLIASCQELEPMPCAVVHPCDESSLRGAVDAARQGLLIPILVGPEQKIRAVAAACELDISGYSIVNASHSHESAETAVAAPFAHWKKARPGKALV